MYLDHYIFYILYDICFTMNHQNTYFLMLQFYKYPLIEEKKEQGITYKMEITT